MMPATSVIDIVDQLRKAGSSDVALRKDAAAEIERLRILVKKLNVQLHFYRNFNQKRERGNL